MRSGRSNPVSPAAAASRVLILCGIAAVLGSMLQFEIDCDNGKGDAWACHSVGEYLSVVKVSSVATRGRRARQWLTVSSLVAGRPR